MTKCRIDDCSLNTFANNTECILHCEKHNYHADANSGVLRPFLDEIVREIAVFPFTYTQETDEVNIAVFRDYLLRDGRSRHIAKFAKESVIVLHNIKFPARDERDNFDYLKVLRKLGAIHFQNCEFHAHGLNLSDVKCFFQDCQFHGNWYIYNTPLLENVNSVLYQNCLFHNYVSSSSDDGHNDDMMQSLDFALFNNCSFKDKLEFLRIEFKAPLFRNSDSIETSINHFQISECIFQDKFILNNCTINKYLSDECVFNSKFELKNNKIQNFMVNDTNHFGLVDTFETEYTKFNIHKSIFKEFAGFENCRFGSIQDKSVQNISTFKYATFQSFVNFRNTIFHSGLDIKNINLKETPNFLNSEIHSENSNRETFRIIKNSFDKIGNNIEANKFFVLEMKKYKEDLKGTNQYQERFLLWLSGFVSDFGQSYIKPILFIIASSILYTWLVIGYDNNVLYEIFPSANDKIETIANMLNRIAKNILPFKNILDKGMEFVNLIFYIVFTSLIWQTVVALKRHTKK